MRISKSIIAGIAVAALSACSSSETGPPTQVETPPDWEFEERPQYPFGLACGWQLASNIDTTNIAFPDEQAKYWVALIPMLPNTRLRIDGRFPDARYFSYNIYDPLLRPTQALADFELTPWDGHPNPFKNDQRDQPWGGGYTAYVEFTEKPEQPLPNTLYGGEMSLWETSIPQPLLLPIAYRTYIPGEGKDFDGGVGLPLLTLETDDGEVEILPSADCVEPLLPTLGNTIVDFGLNDLLEQTNFIDAPFLAAPGAIPVGNPNAETTVFYGLPAVVIGALRNFLGLPIPEGTEDQLPGGGGLVSNLHNAYTSNLFTRNYGNIAIIRAKAPTFRSDDPTAEPDEQLRYWSVCQNDMLTQRYVACVADFQAHLDEDGYYTVMVSDAADRPHNAIAENSIDWLPWGPYLNATIIYRHMLPNPTFEEAIQNVPPGTMPADVMREYVPVPAFCRKEIVESAGDNVLDIFEACRAYTESLSRGPDAT